MYRVFLCGLDQARNERVIAAVSCQLAIDSPAGLGKNTKQEGKRKEGEKEERGKG